MADVHSFDFSSLHPDHFTREGLYTKTYHRDVYPAVDSSLPHLLQAGKVIIVTGAGSGIGANGIAPAFAQAGAKGLVLVGRRPERLSQTAKAIRKQFPAVNVVEIPTSITDTKAVDSLFDQVKIKFGHADVLVNNAGQLESIMTGPGPIAASNSDVWWSDIETNVKGTYLMARGFLKLLGDKAGTVINLTSGASKMALAGTSGYSTSKVAINWLSEFIAVEHPNVMSVALDPGQVQTEMMFAAMAKFAQDTPALVGGVAVWLATEQAKFLSGRYMTAQWDVEELVAMKENILKGEDLKTRVQGRFGWEG